MQMRITRIRRLLAIAGILLSTPGNGAAQIPSQRELNGFVIGQHRNAIKAAFAKPYDEHKTDDGWVYLIYMLQEKPLAYMVFKFTPDDLDRFRCIQITGDPGALMTPFAGVRLGASAADVSRTIGRPSKTRRLDDRPLEFWAYENRNYSFEFDASKRLVSIQICDFDRSTESLNEPMPWKDVQTRLRSTDLDGMMVAFAPDAEIYQANEVFGVDNCMRKVLSDPKSRFRQGLALVVKALQHELAREPANIDLRVWPERRRMGVVYKFPDGAPVVEIVMTPHTGELRVWEVKLR
jgi:hypothetical protein